MNTTTGTSIPAHVPAHLVHDVDPYRLEGGAQDAHAAWKQVQQATPDIYYTPRYGGYWVLNRASLLSEVWPDHERFASSGAIAIPPMPPGLPLQAPIAIDPPEHHYFRHPIALALSPRRIQDYGVQARALAIELIEGFRAKGECDFVQDFAMHLPMTIFMHMVDLPMEDRAWLISRTEVMTRSGDPVQKGQCYQEILGYLGKWIHQRREQPGTDLISEVLKIRVGDRPITDSEALGECSIILFGGLDTVAATMGFCARFLAEHPEHRRQLIDDPSLIPAAVEELLRRHSIPMVSRRVTRDLELGGVQMKAGDLVILETCLHSLDERAWPEPMKVDFQRRTQDHMAFGKGIHKCPGANLARAELRIFIEEWLLRIPDFQIKPGEAPVTANGAVMGMIRLPLVWNVEEFAL
ncbi:MAG TPA: cytochrome P450 [Ramlibacter sp.]|nr:cytochrome P450 [Ramlibacter sp.]